jgi:DNA-binding beta-propeller fold protein YncE
MNIFREQEFRFATYLDADKLLVSDYGSNLVLEADREGNLTNNNIDRDFNKPEGIAVSATGEVFVVNRCPGSVKVFGREADGKFVPLRTFGEDALNQPVGITIDNATGEVYVADNENHRVVVFKLDGRFDRVIGNGYGQEPGKMFCPCGVALHKGLVIVAEWGNGRVQVFNAKGDSILVVNGFPHAHDVVADDDGGVFVALYSHKRVRKLKISVYEDGTPSFSIEEEYKQLELHPTSVLEENGRIRFVSKTRVQDVEF